MWGEGGGLCPCFKYKTPPPPNHAVYWLYKEPARHRCAKKCVKVVKDAQATVSALPMGSVMVGVEIRMSRASRVGLVLTANARCSPLHNEGMLCGATEDTPSLLLLSHLHFLMGMQVGDGVERVRRQCTQAFRHAHPQRNAKTVPDKPVRRLPKATSQKNTMHTHLRCTPVCCAPQTHPHTPRGLQHRIRWGPVWGDCRVLLYFSGGTAAVDWRWEKGMGVEL